MVIDMKNNENDVLKVKDSMLDALATPCIDCMKLAILSLNDARI
jgi:hypothetical protein